ncbi:uncharacterized protein LOC142904490 [Nelusetta ayraudi]|uniref:uncharacterized protein LOC142904490 n=1 Tax=Nelusetta ayraudi TaxID=303726 RepID=UPI003F72CC81
MAFGFGLCVAFLLSLSATVTCDLIPDGAPQMECHDRYLMIAVDRSIAGDQSQFEAVDETGVHPITEEYAAKCGYTVRVLPLQGLVELRASYFSCHTDNQDDEAFTFRFNLITTHEGLKRKYTVNKSCPLALPWAPREVTCESNYMEVSIMTDVTCPTASKREDWDSAVQTAYSSANSEWQLMFKKDGVLTPKNFSEAEAQGYVFEVTAGRLVFRTPYGQPDSFRTEVNGVPVEAVHPLLFARQRWVVLMVEVVAACSVYKASHSESGHILWEIPSSWHPVVTSLHKTRTSVGVSGALEDPTNAEGRGYLVEDNNDTVRISIPAKAEGGHRKSVALGELAELYVFELYLEQVATDDDDNVTTRLRVHKTLESLLLQRPLLFENRTDPEEQCFSVFLGDIPADVTLAAVRLNGVELAVPFGNASSYALTEESQANDTHGYVLKVPLDDAGVMQQRSKEEALMRYRLDLNYTLMVLPARSPFHKVVSVELLMDVVPPVFTASCSESGVSFSVKRQPFFHLWNLSVGPDLLTPELAAQHGYNMSSDDQGLQLHVPLFSHGFTFQNITLKGFTSTFEILVLDAETSEVHSAAAETCSFAASELILCSTDGMMTLVADLSAMVLGGRGSPDRPNLLDRSCRPEAWDGGRVLFSFPVNGCGSKVQVVKEMVTYKNQISLSQSEDSRGESGSKVESVTVQCTYPLSGLHSFFSTHKFESDTPGAGQILNSTPAMRTSSPEDKPITTVQPTTVPPLKRVRYVLYQSNLSPRYVKVTNIIERRRTQKGYQQSRKFL